MTKMTSRERVLMTVGHKEPDRVPMDLGGLVSTIMIGPPYGYSGLCEYLGVHDYPEPEIACFANTVMNVDERILKRFQTDFRTVHVGGKRPEVLPNGLLRDQWGVILKPAGPVNSIPNDLCPLREARTIDDIEGYKYWPDTRDPTITRGKMREARNYHENTDYAVLGDPGFGALFGHMYAWLRGFDNFLLDLKWKKDFAHALFDKISTVAVEYTKEFLSAVGDYLDIVFFADDLAMQTSTFFREDVYEEFIKPVHKRWVEQVRRIVPRAKLMYHSCGAIHSYIPHIIDLGVDILNPIQPKAKSMDPETLKRDFGDKLCFHGGLDIQELLPFGSSSEVREEVKKVIGILGQGGGYILAAAHEFTQEVPPENIVALYDAGLEFGRYPIGR